ncbi:MAG: Trp family transcriptional regulator [Candidatus Dojkabacteria bacterium]|nr:Trp family transcriptional regulator [Candidatus Dojkabacteria bacterium]MDQ7021725.1 Trp family transcriptional regulator [Candidatus Dojkabacteria bacterium]
MKKSSFNKLVDILAEINDPKEISKFLKRILTAKEMKEIPKRIDIVELILKGEKHHDIAKKLGVGVATVTRGSKALKNGELKIIKSS